MEFLMGFYLGEKWSAIQPYPKYFVDSEAIPLVGVWSISSLL